MGKAVGIHPATGLVALVAGPSCLASGARCSRRITQEHRLVFRVTDERVDFLQARYHC